MHQKENTQCDATMQWPNGTETLIAIEITLRRPFDIAGTDGADGTYAAVTLAPH